MNREELIFTARVLTRSKDPKLLDHIVRNSHPSDLANALNMMRDEDIVSLLSIIEPQRDADIFSYFTHSRQDSILRLIPFKKVVQLFEHMPSDERVDLFNRLSEETKKQLLPALDKAERDDILRFASYPEGTVGSITTSDYVYVGANMTVFEALNHIRMTAQDKETIYVIYVVNNENKLKGTVSLQDLVLAKENEVIGNIMKTDTIYVNATSPKEEASKLIRDYDLLALPVLNGEERMIGIVTVDDAMDIEKESNTKGLTRFGGVVLGGGTDLDITTSPFTRMFKARAFWLTILTFFGIFTSTFVAAQEEILSKVIVLAAFIAPIVDMGGNTGSQSATLVIRAMALGQVNTIWRDIWFVIRRELPVAAALGISIGVLEVILAYFSKGVGVEVLAVVGLSMLTCTAMGGIIGALLPFAARRIGTDPATLSSPLITSIMDLLGVLIYFGFAYFFLSDLLA